MEELKPHDYVEGEYVTPPLGSGDEIDSFDFQAPLANFTEAPAGIKAAVARMEVAYSPCRWKICEDFLSDDHIRRTAIWVRDNLGDKSPGAVLLRQNLPTNADVFNRVGVEGVVAEVKARLTELAVEDPRWAADPVRLFIKPEAHKKSKVADKRWRLIWGVSLVDQLVDRLIYEPMLEAEIKHCADIPAKPGYSFMRGGVDKFVRKYSNGSKKWLSFDAKSFDITAPSWALDAARQLTENMCANPDSAHFRTWVVLSQQREKAAQFGKFVFSNGCVCRKTKPCIQPSGRLTTISTNSKIVVLLRYLWDVHSKQSSSASSIVAMGDDTVQDGLDDPDSFVAFVKEVCGVTFTVESAPGLFEDQNFCSMEMKLNDSGVYVPVPLNWAKNSHELCHPESKIAKKEELLAETCTSTLLSLCVQYAFSPHFPELHKMLCNFSAKHGVTHKIRSAAWCRGIVTGYECASSEDDVLVAQVTKPRQSSRFFPRALLLCLISLLFSLTIGGVVVSAEPVGSSLSVVRPVEPGSSCCLWLQAMGKSPAQKLAKALKKKQAKAKKPKQFVKKLEKVAGKVLLTGHGDYIPTRFNRVKGHGGYISDAAGALGNHFGGGLGGLLGSVGGRLFEGITGMGDYRQRAQAQNEAYKKSGAIDMAPLNMGAMNVQFAGGTAPRVRHREFIGPVIGSTVFTTTIYRIQPGLRGVGVLFPWASSVANCFTQYKLHGMVLEYKTTSTNYSSQVGLGSVMMSTQYDAESSPLASQIAVDNNEFTTSDTPATSFIHPIECAADASSITVRYVQANNSSGGTDDERFNDVGIFQVSTIGQTDSAGLQVGELWASYDIEFLKPALPDLHAGTTYLASFSSVTNNQCIYGSGVTASIDQGSSYPVQIGPSGGGSFLLPVGYAGKYLLQWTWTLNGEIGVFGLPPFPQTWGPDVTSVKAFPSSALTEFDSSNILNVNQLDSTSQAYSDRDAAATAYGYQGAFLFETIAESAGNNYIILAVPAWNGTGATATKSVYSCVITAVDNDLPTGVYSGSTPAMAFQDRKKLRNEMVQDVRKVQDLQKANTALTSRLSRLETLFQALSRPASPMTEPDEPEFGVSASAPPAKRKLALPDIEEVKTPSVSATQPVPKSLFGRISSAASSQ